MTRMVKTFTIKEPEQPAEPIPFEFRFIPKDPDGEPKVEQFEAYGKAPVGATLAMSSMIRYGSRGTRNIDMNGMMEFFEKAMPPEDYERMRDMFDDPKWIIDIDDVGEVFTWLTEQYSDRPTRRSRRSSRTGPDNGRNEQGVVIALDPDSVEETS
jgi:hypothetical protein